METYFLGTIYTSLILVVLFQVWGRTEGSSNVDKVAARDQVLEMFLHGYNSYMKYAYPADELMPLSCSGRVRGKQPPRGDVDDALGKFSLTLIDTLDTLAVLGLMDEFEVAVQRVIHDVTFDTDIVVSVFETNIRVLGGLLGGHIAAIGLRKHHNRVAWYKDELLYMAKDLGYRLLPAFNTSTGVPYPRVNLRHGIGKDRTEKNTCTACAGSMLLEFSALSRLTGDPIFEEKAKHVMHTLWSKRQRTSNLVGTVINIHTGDWVRKDSGIGAGIDSYYEYLLKGYILLGDEGLYDRFTTHYDAIMTYINKGPNFIDVHMHRPHSKSRNFMDSLFAFWPGLQVLFGDIAPAIETHEMLYQVTQRHNFLPEAFTPDYDVYWGQHPLRPEFVESTYFLYKATNDPHYLDVGKDVMDSLQNYARVPCGFAGIKDVRTGSHEDRMDSFVLAETFKYLFLLFSEPKDLVLPIDDYLFTTEAHILPLTLAHYKLNGSNNRMEATYSGPKDPSSPITPRSCPSHNFNFPTGKGYADAIRGSLPKMEPVSSCPMPVTNQEQAIPSAAPRLKASEFVPGNTEHMRELGKMGIQLITLDDGRVQLMHSATKASSTTDAEEGMKFMQEIIAITKTQQSDSVEYHPRVVQVISPEGIKNVVLAAGPAQFGLNLETSGGVAGTLVQVDPFHGCTEPVNKDQIFGRVAMAQRGNCMFIEKARMLESCGAIGVIIMDNNESSSSDTATVFAMSGDGTDDVPIAVIFLFYKEGQILIDALRGNSQVDVLMLDKAKPQAEVDILYAQLNRDGLPENVDDGPVPREAPETRYYSAADEALEQSQGGGGGTSGSDGAVGESSPSNNEDEALTAPDGDNPALVDMENVRDLLKYLGEDSGAIDDPELKQRMESALLRLMQSENGPDHLQVKMDADVGDGDDQIVGHVVAPEDMGRVLKQIQEEFTELEDIRAAFNKLNPDRDAAIPDDGIRDILRDNEALPPGGDNEALPPGGDDEVLPPGGDDDDSRAIIDNNYDASVDPVQERIPNHAHNKLDTTQLDPKSIPSGGPNDDGTKFSSQDGGGGDLSLEDRNKAHAKRVQNILEIQKREENLESQQNKIGVKEEL